MTGLLAPIYVPTPGYCMTGMYRSYIGDGDGNTGSVKTWADNIKARTGQPVEVVMISSGLNLSWGASVFAGTIGAPQFVLVQVPLTAGNGLAATIAGTNTAKFKNIAQLMVNAGLGSRTRAAVVLGWESTLATATSGFDWAVLRNGQTTAQYAQAFQVAVTAMRSVTGFDAGFVWDTGYHHGTNMVASYPGDAYVDYIGFHPYNGITSTSATPRNNVPLWLSNDLQVSLDIITNFARAHSKLCIASEYCLEQPAIGDTTSNTYVYHTIDTDLYYPFLQNYWGQNSDVWVAVAHFNQNQGSSPGPWAEWNQMIYLGTDPASQSSIYPVNTNFEGTAYYAIDTQHSLSRPTYKTSVLVAGSMQKSAPPTPPAPPTKLITGARALNEYHAFVY